jgi:putative ABC transport system substrate-binding protein
MTAEYGMAGKRLELLKQIAPGVTRVAILRDPTLPAGLAQFGAIQSVASSVRSTFLFPIVAEMSQPMLMENLR